MRRIVLLFISILLVSCSNPLEKEIGTYRVKVTTSPGETGVISPSPDSTYEEGQTISISAAPTQGYVFENWSGDINSSENPYVLTVDRNYSLTANFGEKTYELVVNTTGGGIVTEEVVQTKSGDYEHGTVVRLTAKPESSYRFVGWEGDIESSENPVEIVIDQPKEVTAVFEKRSYELEIHVEGNGTVTEEVVQSNAKDYEHGTEVELTAEPASGYRFIEWRGDVSSTENPVRITIDEPKEVTAVFEHSGFELDVRVRGKGEVIQEVVMSKPDDYPAGTNVRLTAEPEEGWQFSGWEGDISRNNRDKNPVVIHVSYDKTITAVFSRNVGGTIWGDQTLTRSEGPYFLTEKVSIAGRSSLTLEEGVKIYGRGNVIEVLGKLKVKGSEDSEVILENVVIKPGRGRDGDDDDDWDDDDDDDDDREEDEDRDDDEFDGDNDNLFEIEIEHAVLIGGELLPPAGSPASGRIILKESFLYEVNRSSDNSKYMYIWYPQKKCTIEQNIFYNSGRIVTRLNRDDVHIKNNYFYRDEFLSDETGYAVENRDSRRRSETEVRDNTFANTQGVAVSFSKGFSDKKMDATKNYWSTTSTDVIESMIYDGNDDFRIFREIPYQPYRRNPHGRTPVLPDSLR